MELDSSVLAALEEFTQKFNEYDYLSVLLGESEIPNKQDSDSVKNDSKADFITSCDSEKSQEMSKPTVNGETSYKNVTQKLLIPEKLVKYITYISKTGQTIFPWSKVKPVFLCKLDETMRKFNDEDPLDDLLHIPNCASVPFNTLHKSIMKTVAGFKQAPFTIQRLCELVVEPKQHYKRIDKFLRGIEKNILIVTTVDCLGNKLCSETDLEERPIHDDIVLTSSKATGLSSMLGWFNKSTSSPPSSSTVSLPTVSSNSLESTKDSRNELAYTATAAPAENTPLATGTKSPEIGPDPSMYTPEDSKRSESGDADSPSLKRQKLDTDNIVIDNLPESLSREDNSSGDDINAGALAGSVLQSNNLTSISNTDNSLSKSENSERTSDIQINTNAAAADVSKEQQSVK